MLHEVAASDLEISAIVNPIHKLLRVRTFSGSIEAIDLEKKCVAVSHGADRHAHELGYDHLIVALGSSTNFLGIPGLEECALTIKTLTYAVALRNQLITQLEEANSECAAEDRQPLLTFVVVGAGFAGVETLGAVNDFVRESICYYPNLNPNLVRTVLISSEEFVLPELGPKLGAYALRKLIARGIEVIAGVRVVAICNGWLSFQMEGRSVLKPWCRRRETRRILSSPSYRCRRKADESRSTNILKFRTHRACGRWVIARWYRTARPEDSIRRPRSTHFAKADASRATSPRRSSAAGRKPFDSPPSDASLPSAIALE
jgi:hypothetical protein